MAKFILAKVGDKFCERVEQEKEAKVEAKKCGGNNRKLYIVLISNTELKICLKQHHKCAS